MVKETEKKKSLTTKVLKALLIVVGLNGVTMGLFSYFVNRNTVISEHGNQAMFMASTLAAAIDAQGYGHIVKTGEQDDYWYELKGIFDNIRTETRALCSRRFYKKYISVILQALLTPLPLGAGGNGVNTVSAPCSA